ncbi:MAG: GNAT family N-acetyltransferase [Gemmatimonadetes bacterium]|nr:GNAT family N-acetyltransferase [Gemmatimonadota bacterium]
MSALTFRAAPTRADLRRVRAIVASTGFFTGAETDVAVDLLRQRLQEGRGCGYRFVFAELDGKPVAYTCYRRDGMTRSAFDLYWIATERGAQGRGIGRALLAETCRRVRTQGGTMLVAETSGRDLYAPTRAFYLRTGFVLVARIPDYYDRGDDKCIYLRTLA